MDTMAAGNKHAWQARTLVIGTLLVVATVAGLLRLGQPSDAHAAGPYLYTQKPCVNVYAQPSTSSTLLTQLLAGTEVAGTDKKTVGGKTWQHVQFWGGLDGYIDAGSLSADFAKNPQSVDCTYPGIPEAIGNPIVTNHGPWTLTATGKVANAATVFALPDDKSMPMASLPIGLPLTLTAWASDASGRPWYQVATAETKGQQGWIWSGHVQIDTPNPATHQVNGKPIWAPIAGKGMYFTNFLPRHSDINAMVQAAKKDGITHIYAEVAITRYGVYGQKSLDRLLPVAHAAGIPVIAWIYTNLDNITDDIRMTQETWAYRTPTGDHADGLLMDVEEVTDTASVYTYGQVTRALLGPDVLFVASVFHPFARPGYPYGAIAASWNVIAPMNYWHSRQSKSYTADDVKNFVSTSIETIRAAMAASGNTPLPVEETGQTYDMFSSSGAGSHEPTAAEITADMQTAKDLGCTGVAWFEWQTTTQSEWSAISDFVW
jgi:Bacterial SH3 domain